jgi:hypothetical protein
MSVASTSLGVTVWELPPLILHPFNERVPPAELLENSKAALMLSGLIPNNGADPEALRRQVLAGRYSEVRMLYFLGKDVFRWLEQCVELLDRFPELVEAEVHEQSFAGLLATAPPECVLAKLKAWGVFDYSAIFSRAMGLHSMFQKPPEFGCLSDQFLKNYHRYADYLYKCFVELQEHNVISAQNFHFELYASGEYSRMLENEWGTGTEEEGE